MEIRRLISVTRSIIRITAEQGEAKGTRKARAARIGVRGVEITRSIASTYKFVSSSHILRFAPS